MKKQLLIAAVAASMTSVAMADISITGGAKINYTNTDFELGTKQDTNIFKHDIDLKIVGQNGGTQVVAVLANEQSEGNDLDLEDRYVTSSVGDVNVKAGAWDNGNDFVSASSRTDGKFSANTTISGAKITYDANNSGGSNAVTVSGSIGGVNASYKDEVLGEEIKVSTTVAGVTLAYHADNSDTANSDRSSIEVSGEVSGVKLAYVQIDADSAITIDGDSWAGDFEDGGFDNTTNAVTTNAYDLSQGQDVTAMKVSTSMAGNTIAFTRTDVDGVTGEDTSFNKFTVTRPLASGATFEATYTTISDDKSTTTDADILDLELAVKF